jgi:hypothetical protein
MIEIVRNSIYILYILFIIVAAFGFFKRDLGLIIFSYLVVSFKTNILGDSSEISQYFEPQYIIGLIWLLAIATKKIHYYYRLSKTDKYIFGFALLYSFAVVFEPLKYLIIFKLGYSVSIKTILKTFIDLLVIYTFIGHNIKNTINSNYIKNGIILGVLIIAFQFFVPQSEVAIGINNFLTKEGLRYGGIMKANLNELAQVMLMPAYFIIVLIANNKINKTVGIISFLLISYGVLETGSRSGLFSLTFIILFLPFNPDLANKVIFNKKRASYLVIVLGAIFIGYYLLPIYGQTSIRRLRAEQLDENVRVLRYPEYFTFFSDNPLYLFTGAFSEIRGKYSHNYDSHSFYIGKVYMFGIFYLYLNLFLLWKIANSPNKLLKFPVILFLIFGITGSSPPLGFMPYILYYFSHYFYQNNPHNSFYKHRKSSNITLHQ